MHREFGGYLFAQATFVNIRISCQPAYDRIDTLLARSAGRRNSAVIAKVSPPRMTKDEARTSPNRSSDATAEIFRHTLEQQFTTATPVQDPRG
jgi:hypothetical protein